MNDDTLEIDLFQSLTQPILLGGVPRAAAIIIWTFGAVLALPLGFVGIGLSAAIVVHGTLAYLTKRDQHYVEVMLRHLRQPPFWT